MCLDASNGRRLIDYLLRRLSAAEEAGFEAHLLECDRCYGDFLALSRASDLVSEYTGEGGADLPVLPARPQRRLDSRVVVVLVAAALLAGFLAAVAMLRG